MRLHSIKLSGFKSFADSTSVSFPAQLAGVVGPNGSGKSNIIDAIRWVMGERSARELRGGHISDVIFNGSSSRKEASLARIELHFENAYGRLRGEYARFNEISVAREVDTEGHSVFYLNNVRCRRRDVIDAFLGTGLGARSYAIIQQGTVSRLVEAKPEELRQHLEEVAGISLYKERRHETALRLKNTKENLSRLLDTIEELDKRLKQLQRQAGDAKKYRVLKEQSDLIHNQLIVARCRKFDFRLENLKKSITNNELKTESAIAKVRESEAEQARVNAAADEMRGKIEQQQQGYYEYKQAIALLEREKENLEERSQELLENIEQAGNRQQQQQAQQGNDKAELSDLEIQITQQTEAVKQQQDDLTRQNTELSKVEKDFQQLQGEYQQSQRQNYEIKNQLELLRYQINEQENSLEKTNNRVKQFANPDEEQLNASRHITEAITREKDALQRHKNSLAEREKQLSDKREQLQQSTRQLKQKQGELQQTEKELRLCEGRIESLQTLIDNKTRQPGVKITRQELVEHKLSPVLKNLKVATGWEAAVESALGHLLSGYLAESGQSISTVLKSFKDSGVAIGRVGDQPDEKPPAGLLPCSEIIKGAVPGWVHGIWFATDLQQGLQHWDKLATGQRIVCKDGSQLSKDWIVLGHLPEGETLVSLQKRLTENKKESKKLQQNLASLEKTVISLDVRATEAGKQLDILQEQLRAGQRDLHAAQSRYDKLDFQKGAASQAEDRRKQQHGDAVKQAKELKQSLVAKQQQLTKLLEKQEKLEQNSGDIGDRYNFAQTRVQNLRGKVKELQADFQAKQLRLGQFQARRDFLLQSVEAREKNIEQLQSQIARDKQQVEELKKKPQSVQSNLTKNIEQLQKIDETLVSLRAGLGNKLHEGREITSRLEGQRSSIDNLKEEHQQSAIQQTEIVTKQEELLKQLIEENLETVANKTPQDFAINDKQKEFDKLERSIRMLGEVNHAAIKDYDTENERRQSLDKQHNEILQAITTLEQAINKIDKETKTLFRQTFDQLNTNLKRVFPDLLGGGNAWLELTSSDLLESGVQIIARPPGKKNATVAMLSGGEKAMTAISLVLALFSLNPAPFCVLDEVDAPLDDNNIIRFASTIQKISSNVQFIVVTHSKVTMEYMDTLLGITMSEPGVSRIVTVDIDSALQLVD